MVKDTKLEKLTERVYNQIWDYVDGDCGVIDVIEVVFSAIRNGLEIPDAPVAHLTEASKEKEK